MIDNVNSRRSKSVSTVHLTIDDVNARRITLEFGNPTHIQFVKDNIIPEGLKRYMVTFDIRDQAEFLVDAKDKIEAEEMAYEQFEIEDIDIETTVTEIAMKGEG